MLDSEAVSVSVCASSGHKGGATLPAELNPYFRESPSRPNTPVDFGSSGVNGCVVRHDPCGAQIAHDWPCECNRRDAIAEACFEQGVSRAILFPSRGGRSSNAKQTSQFRNALRPRSWRVRTRRAFVMSLPIALPIWLVYVVSLYFAELGAEATASFRPFWSAPPRTYGSYGRYFFGGRSEIKQRRRA